MTAKTIPHDTQVGYKYHRCRCGPCRAANTAYSRTRNRLIAYGQWQPNVDGGQVREHLALLAARGWSQWQIAVAAGADQATISRVMSAPDRMVRVETARKILAVDPASHPGSGFMPVVGSMRRLRALAAVGHGLPAVAAVSGLSESGLSVVRRGVTATVEYATHVAVMGAYGELSMVRGEGRGASRARRVAADAGWVPPLGWDDEWLDLSEDDLAVELARLVGRMEVAELRRCDQARRDGDRSPLVVAASLAFRDLESAAGRARRRAGREAA